MKRTFKFIILFIFIFSLAKQVNANSISSINMDIYLSDTGDATITETWQTYLDEGTENYHPYFNIGNSKIIFNSVKDDRGTTYNYNSNWNIDNSFEIKKNTFGIYNSGNEYDLCWGISEYGNRTYTLNYTIQNFIYNTTDNYQILYWTLIPKGMSSSVDKVYIKVHANNNFSDDLPVWGYGNYGGTAYVYNGIIEATSPEKGLSTDQYMTILVKFSSNTFNTTNSIDKSWDEVYSEAKKGATAYKENDNSFMSILSNFLYIIVAVLVFVPYALSAKRKKNHMISGKDELKDVLPFRDIPFGEDYFYTNYLAQEYDLISTDTNILGAMFLKWIKNNYLTISTEEKGIFKTKTTKFIINPNSINQITDPNELKLWDIINKAAVDNILEDNEFKKYCKKNYQTLLNLFDNINDNIDKNLKNNNAFITTVEIKKTFGTSKKYTATSKLNEDARKLAGLKVFFKDFTSLNEKQPIEVKQWREYLIYAQILGMAEQVAKEFKKFYPDVITDVNYNDIILINNFSNNGVYAAMDARSRAQNYSAGGGGFSFGGGGGGSFGGGGSGGGSR
jgi:hypothetical protein